MSGPEQRLDLQLDALLKEGVDSKSIYTDEASGGPRTKRPGFDAMWKALRGGDTLVVWKLDRLGRSLVELFETMERIRAKAAHLRVITEKIDTSTATGHFVFQIMAAMAEMERGLIQERTMAGLSASRGRGKKPGRKSAMTAEMDDQAVEMLTGGGKPPEVAEKLGVGRSTLYEAMRGRLAERLLPGSRGTL